MHEFVELVKALAWPVTLLIGVCTLRSELRLFMTRISEAISQAAQITVGRRGVDIKLAQRITAVNTRVTAVQAMQIQTRTAHRLKHSDQTATKVPDELLVLASQYCGLQIADYRTRLHRKNALALEMGEIVVRSRLDRALLSSHKDEALALALTAATIAEPRAADFDLVLDASTWCKRLHVRYRIVLAISVLINEGLTPPSSGGEIQQALTTMSEGADQPLINIITDTKALMDSDCGW
ncbi:hypothetical protein AB8Z38_23555 [Bradyrhizobium sp. LLZ17]|uniref:Uncharacterized protein n=1 Tax=Bradyrhizobium sp. LLZ17 TaxID=3239388 RepID=A0AB39XFB9_9BRAD